MTTDQIFVLFPSVNYITAYAFSCRMSEWVCWVLRPTNSFSVICRWCLLETDIVLRRRLVWYHTHIILTPGRPVLELPFYCRAKTRELLVPSFNNFWYVTAWDQTRLLAHKQYRPWSEGSNMCSVVDLQCLTHHYGIYIQIVQTQIRGLFRVFPGQYSLLTTHFFKM